MYRVVFPLQVVIYTRCTMEDVHGRLALWSLYSIITLLNSSPLLLPKTINCKNDTCDYISSQSYKIGGIYVLRLKVDFRSKPKYDKKLSV